MRIQCYSYSLLLFLAFPVLLMAQEQDPNLPTEEVDVVKQFNARLIDAERYQVRPELPPLDTTPPRLNYELSRRTFNAQYNPPSIRPIALRRDREQSLYNGYGILAGGLPGSMLLEGAYDMMTDENVQFGVDLRHYSANNNSSVENQTFGLNNINLSGAYFSDQGIKIDGFLDYRRDIYHFYGYNQFAEENNTEISFEDTDVKQRFSDFSAEARISNSERTVANVNYDGGISFYSLQDNYAARENGVRLDLGFTKWFADTHPLSVELITDFTNYRDTSEQSLNNFFLKPEFPR